MTQLPPNADLEDMVRNSLQQCGSHSGERFIDHIIFDKRSTAWVVDGSLQQMDYKPADLAFVFSDHCPTSVQINP